MLLLKCIVFANFSMCELSLRPSAPDDLLSDMLRAVPQLLPPAGGAPPGGEQGELVLSPLQILPRLWPQKQERQGTFLIRTRLAHWLN